MHCEAQVVRHIVAVRIFAAFIVVVCFCARAYGVLCVVCVCARVCFCACAWLCACARA